MRFKDNQEFQRLLNARQNEILQLTNNGGIMELPSFQRLLSLLKASRQRYEDNGFKLVLISKSDLKNLAENAEEKVNDLFINQIFLTNKQVVVDSYLEIINYNNTQFPSDNNDARRYFTSLSDNGMIVFLIAPNAIVDYFIDKNDYGPGIFYSNVAYNSYQERKTIDQLMEVLNEYRLALKQRNTYQKFFVTKSQLKMLRSAMNTDLTEDKFLKMYNHLLNNRPEDAFREDMRLYIKQHMRVTLREESVLEDLDRLDIEMYDELGQDLYFIEVKWVGDSISANGDSISTSYDEKPRINPDAVGQVVGYIKQLLDQKENIRLGYLAVFDARKDEKGDTGQNISVDILPEDLKRYFPRFKKIKDFRVINENPR